ncbi:hypothetical protein SAMN05421692_0005 [Chryseobacterium indologenes]|nr:hypothetical protein SAMN05421692_0005 [Chryseobacterium indologenes]SUX50778.1 Uncharacterised protein [Chryseobacterium indologenes]
MRRSTVVLFTEAVINYLGGVGILGIAIHKKYSFYNFNTIITVLQLYFYMLCYYIMIVYSSLNGLFTPS